MILKSKSTVWHSSLSIMQVGDVLRKAILRTGWDGKLNLFNLTLIFKTTVIYNFTFHYSSNIKLV